MKCGKQWDKKTECNNSIREKKPPLSMLWKEEHETKECKK